MNSVCDECTTPLELYDYSFLVFHALVPLFVNGLFVKWYSARHSRSSAHTYVSRTDCLVYFFSLLRSQLWLIAQLACCLLESSIAFVCSLLLVKPVGSLVVHGCRKGGIQEWYPMFHNPVINYTHTLRCTYEVVYPL